MSLSRVAEGGGGGEGGSSGVEMLEQEVAETLIMVPESRVRAEELP